MFILWEYVYQGKNNYVAKHTWKNLLVVGSVWGVAVDSTAVDSAVEAVIVDETDCTVAGTAVVSDVGVVSEVVSLTVVSAVVPTVADGVVVSAVWAAVVDAAVVSNVVVSTVWTAVVDAAVGGCVAPRSTVNIYNVIKDFY